MYSAALTAVISASVFLLRSAGVTFGSGGSVVMFLFLLILVLVQKESNHEDLVAEIREEKEIIQRVARGYEELAALHRDDTKRAVGRVVAVSEEVKQRVEELACREAAKPADPDCPEPSAP